jgi:outer membrane protein
MKRIFALTITGLVLSQFGFSQVKVWNFGECINYAIENNISLKQKGLNNQITQLNLEKARADLLPNLNASAGQNFQFGRSLDTYTNTYTTNNSASSNYGLSSRATLFNGFQNINTIKKYQSEQKVDEFDFEKMKNEVTLNVLNAYLQVLLAKEQLESAKVAVQNSQAIVDRTEKLVKAGTKAINDLLQVKSQLATDRYTLTSRENTLAIANVSLMQLMELPVDSTFEIAVPEDETALFLTEQLAPSSEVFDSAMSLLPEIRSAEWKIKSAEYDYQIAKGAVLPQLTISGNLNTGYSNNRSLFDITTHNVTQTIGYLASNPSELVLQDNSVTSMTSRKYPYTKQLNDNFSQSVSIGLSIPIFNNKQAKTSKSIAKVNMLNEQLALQSSKNVLRKEVEQNQADLNASWKNFMAAGEQKKAAEESYKNAESKYTLGMLNSIDLVTEKKNLTQATSNYLQAKYENLFQSKINDYYLGRGIKF